MIAEGLRSPHMPGRPLALPNVWDPGTAGRIARAVDVPVTVGAEAGYGLAPAELADRLLAVGAAGCVEDTGHQGGGQASARHQRAGRRIPVHGGRPGVRAGGGNRAGAPVNAAKLPDPRAESG